MRLIGVGMGPGDPELVTVKAVRLLRDADRIFVPVLDPAERGRAEATVRAHVDHDRIERLVFVLNERHDAARRERHGGREEHGGRARRAGGREEHGGRAGRAGGREEHWDAAGRRVARWLAETGGTGVFATIGDPNLYSTFSYLAATVRDIAPGVTISTVPGITAMQALAAASGTPLAEGTEPLVLVPLAGGAGPLAAALEYGGDGSVVAYKAGRHLPEVSKLAAEHHRLDTAVYGEHLGMADETVTPLADAAEGPYLSTVLFPAARDKRGGRL